MAKQRSIKRLSIENLKEIPDDWPGDPEEFEPGWWIKDPNNPEVLYVGPYATRRELDENGDKQGLERFWRQHAC